MEYFNDFAVYGNNVISLKKSHSYSYAEIMKTQRDITVS